VDLRFSGEIVCWRGPAPWYFVIMPDEECHELARVAKTVTYGWGVIPVAARIGATGWTTSLFPKDGRYLVPVKAAVRKAEGLDEGDTVNVRLTIGAGPAPAARQREIEHGLDVSNPQLAKIY
jgi:hypothetical protein